MGKHPMKNRVKLTIAERLIASEVTISESIHIIQDNSLGIRNFCQTDIKQALRGGQTTMMSMAAEQIYFMLGKEAGNFAKIATSIYQAGSQSLLEAICDPEEAEALYRKTEQCITIKNKDTVILQECILLYPKHIRLKLMTNHELTPIDRMNMAGMYLPCIYPANAIKVTAVAHYATDVEKQ